MDKCSEGIEIWIKNQEEYLRHRSNSTWYNSWYEERLENTKEWLNLFKELEDTDKEIFVINKDLVVNKLLPAIFDVLGCCEYDGERTETENHFKEILKMLVVNSL